MRILKTTLLIGIFFLAFTSLKAQKIDMYKTFGGVRYMQGDTLLLAERQVMMVLYKENRAAFDEFRKAKGFYTASNIVGFAGGVLVGLPIGTALVGGDPEWWFAAGGAALIVASVPLNRIYKGRALGALDIYNGVTTQRIKPSLFFTGSRAGIVIRF